MPSGPSSCGDGVTNGVSGRGRHRAPPPPSSPKIQSASAVTRYDLFGGAMCCQLPPGLVDVSAFRDVPDHQEVWVTSDSDRLAVSVEVLEYARDVPDDHAALYFFEDLAQCNEAQSHFLTLQPHPVHRAGALANVSSIWACAGMQRGVSKFKKQAQGDVLVWLAVLRLPAHSADVLVTVTSPEAAATSVDAAGVFALVLSTLEIRDTSLFA